MKFEKNNISTVKKEEFVELLNLHKRMIYKIVNSYCRNHEDQKDLEQEITIQLWHSFDNYDSSYKYSTWIYRIALNVAISFYRKQKSRQSKLVTFPKESLFDIKHEEDYDKDTDNKIELLQQFINQLDELNKALILLYLDEKKQEEIADILGISKTNVATKISRLKIKLSNEFKKHTNDGNN